MTYNIKQKVEEDLKVYDQENLYPSSLTIHDGEYWRHYELGPCYGFVVYNTISKNGENWFGIMALEEDDDFWYIPEQGMHSSSYWVEDLYKTLGRVKDWIEEHLYEGYDGDCWVTKVIKEF